MGLVGMPELCGHREVAVVGMWVMVVANAEGRPGVGLEGQTRKG